jgi:hypothetical protein
MVPSLLATSPSPSIPAAEEIRDEREWTPNHSAVLGIGGGIGAEFTTAAEGHLGYGVRFAHLRVLGLVGVDYTFNEAFLGTWSTSHTLFYAGPLVDFRPHIDDSLHFHALVGLGGSRAHLDGTGSDVSFWRLGYLVGGGLGLDPISISVLYSPSPPVCSVFCYGGSAGWQVILSATMDIFVVPRNSATPPKATPW